MLGQIGMSPGAAAATPALFGTGAPDRLALEMERISPYANTPAGNVSASYPNFCPGPGNGPCAIPEILFPFSGTIPAGSTTSFLVDVGTGVGGGAGSIFNSSFGQILPGAPPYPNPNQFGGLGNGIAVNLYREAFFAGTTTVLTAPGAAIALPVTADTDGAAAPGPHVQDLDITGTISGYSALPACALSGGGGTGATCSLAAGQSAGDLALTNGVLVAGPNCTAALPPAVHGCGAASGASVFFCSSCITAGGSGYTSSPTVTFTPAPANNGALSYLATSPLSAPILPVPPTQGSFSGAPGTGSNAGETCATPPCAGNGPEDVIFGAIQFYDAIASPTAINFTATVNSFPSITGPNGLTGANAKAIVNYTNWAGELVNVPPGCIISPNVPAGPGGIPRLYRPTDQRNPLVPGDRQQHGRQHLGPVAFPGVVSSLITFSKSDACTGIGFPPGLDGWDPLTLTLTVSAPHESLS